VLRRTRTSEPQAADRLRVGPLEIDRAAREVRVRGQRRELTGRQFDLLLLLAERAGRVQTRDQLMDALKGEEWDNVDRSIDVHISRIRQAIEDDPRHPRLVQDSERGGLRLGGGARGSRRGRAMSRRLYHRLYLNIPGHHCAFFAGDRLVGACLP